MRRLRKFCLVPSSTDLPKIGSFFDGTALWNRSSNVGHLESCLWSQKTLRWHRFCVLTSFSSVPPFRLLSPTPDSSMLLFFEAKICCCSLRQGHWIGPSRSSSCLLISGSLISRIIMVIARCGKACWDLSVQAARAARVNFVTFLSVCSLIKCRATTTFSVICRIPSFNNGEQK